MRQTGRQPGGQSRRTGRRPAPTTAELAALHDRVLSSDRPPRDTADLRTAARTGPSAPAETPRPEIGDSWERLRRLGLDPDRGAAAVHLGPAEVEHRRRVSGLDPLLPVLRDTLLAPMGQTPLLLAVADAEGHVLWQEGERQLRRSADRIGFLTGARWVEENVGTNGIASALRAERPMQVHSAEHYLRSHHAWTCVAAPVHDPSTGRLVGVVNLSGPAQNVQPYLLQLTATAARLAETELRARRLESLHHLRTVATPLLARLHGPALVVDAAGWTAAAAGLPPTTRLRLPADGWAPGPVQWLPSLGECLVEPLADGWLVRPVQSPDGPDAAGASAEQAEGARLRLDLRRPERPELSVHGTAGSWSHALSPRHAEVLLLLATEPNGLSAARLAEGLFGDPGRTVTVRAELSRLRRHLGGLLAHRPYRFTDSVRVSVDGPEDPYDLLPTSSAPAVRRLRAGLAAGAVRLPGPARLPGRRGRPGEPRPPGHQTAGHQTTGHPQPGHPSAGHRPQVHQAQVHQGPVHQAPVHQASAHQAPVHQAPVHQPPASSADSWASVGP
ncbi:GAF domain-containing protein [Kitasatospora sp. NPDC054939]